jgi:hypothetical protein
VFEHFENGVFLGFNSNIGQDAVLGVEQFAKAFEEHHVTGQLALVFVFDAEEHVIVLTLVLGFGFLVPGSVGGRAAQLIGFHPDRIENSRILPRLYVLFAQSLSVIECLVDEFIFLVLFGRKVLLDLLLSLVPHVVFDAEVQAQLLVAFIHVYRQ